MSSRSVPSRATTGLTRAVRTNVPLGWICGGLCQVSETVTGAPGAKPRACTIHGMLAVPRLWPTMHRAGPELPADAPHTVCGAAGGGVAEGCDGVVTELGLGELSAVTADPEDCPRSPPGPLRRRPN